VSNVLCLRNRCTMFGRAFGLHHVPGNVQGLKCSWRHHHECLPPQHVLTRWSVCAKCYRLSHARVSAIRVNVRQRRNGPRTLATFVCTPRAAAQEIGQQVNACCERQR